MTDWSSLQIAKNATIFEWFGCQITSEYWDTLSGIQMVGPHFTIQILDNLVRAIPRAGHLGHLPQAQQQWGAKSVF